MARSHLIIDGYNVIFQAEPYAAFARDGQWDRARDALISDVASYVRPGFRVTVVFDGTTNPRPVREPQRMLGVTVLFSAHGQTADAVIERLAQESRGRGDAVEVVTGDAIVQWTALGPGVVRRSVREFIDQLQHGYGDWERERDAPAKRSTLETRVSPAARDLLRRIREGD
ncbi:MAG: NYN domain-containing protein [Actinomycetes bacterium]|jgi:predicted RNA-binding protein with PIN domain|nr:NYN domain-containing protein [Actinomycetes bacterium]